VETPEKPDKLGAISLILAIIIVILWCVYFALFAAMTEGGVTFGMDGETAGYALVLGGGTIMMILTILLTLAGIVLGIMALRKKDPKRGLAIAGLAINFLCFAPYCLFSLLLIFGGISTSDFMPSFAP
jgi:bacteriorhodopsin